MSSSAGSSMDRAKDNLMDNANDGLDEKVTQNAQSRAEEHQNPSQFKASKEDIKDMDPNKINKICGDRASSHGIDKKTF